MEDRERIERQIRLADRAAAYTLDETTAGRLRWYADELRQKLFGPSRRRKIEARAAALWDEAGCPSGRDLEFWLEAEKQIDTETS